MLVSILGFEKGFTTMVDITIKAKNFLQKE